MELFLSDTNTLAQVGQSRGRNGLFDLVQNMPPGPQMEEDCQAFCKAGPDFLPQGQDGLMGTPSHFSDTIPEYRN